MGADMTHPHRQEFATKRTQIDDDRELIVKVIDHPAMQGTDTRRRFVDMHEKLKRFVGLTDRQRAWVQREAAWLGIRVPMAEHPVATPKHSAWDPEPKVPGNACTQRTRMKRAVKALKKARAKTPKQRRKGTTR
jgi:hypothetical protein